MISEPDGYGSYADETAVVTTPECGWSHSMSDILGSIIGAGLRIERLREFPFAAYRALRMMERGADGWWRLPEHPDLPREPSRCRSCSRSGPPNRDDLTGAGLSTLHSPLTTRQALDLRVPELTLCA